MRGTDVDVNRGGGIDWHPLGAVELYLVQRRQFLIIFKLRIELSKDFSATTQHQMEGD